MEVNRRRWAEMTRLHLTTYVHLDAETAGQDSLKPFEGSELGDLGGKRICHLQCHLASQSMSLARRGATVVGVDFSSESLDIARTRVAQAGLTDRVSFVETSVYEAPSVLKETFDVVYTSWGVLSWLPDIGRWAAIVATLLHPGGFLYLAESHPYAEALRWSESTYGGATPHFDDSQGDYTDDGARFMHPESWNWSHGLGEVVTAVANAGMQIDFLHEHPEVAWHLNDEEHLHKRPDGMWEDLQATLPLSYSIKATKLSAGT
jgi:SAM-dependent methyltransferase